MLVLERDTGRREHRRIADLVEFLSADDLLLLNDTRVIPARLFAHRPTGRKFELLLLRKAGDDVWEALLRPSARARPGEHLQLADGGVAIPEERHGEGRWSVRFDPPLDPGRLDLIGEMPLPPYIGRPEGGVSEDRRDYQTVYASNPGAVAAPTAGLHFNRELLECLSSQGVEMAELTLHVGAGTFQPVKVERVSEHRMHEEWIEVSEPLVKQILTCKERGGRVIAVGTTTVRALESAALNGRLQPCSGPTSIFIYPGFKFRVVDLLLTNFHLPRSTLMMMISAFAGKRIVQDAYQHAVDARYRFFSYGDAMLLTRGHQA